MLEEPSGLDSVIFVSAFLVFDRDLLILIDVLNRSPLKNAAGTIIDGNVVRLAMCIFPRQFGLHNVFTSTIDSRETAQPFKDYTLREEEINRMYGGHPRYSKEKPKIPKRLRGEAMLLVAKLSKLHSRCSYKQLLDYYCPPLVSQMHFLSMLADQ